jgi:hypothetical protein
MGKVSYQIKLCLQQSALTLNPSPEGRGTLNLAPFSLGRRVGDEGLGMQQRLFDLVSLNFGALMVYLNRAINEMSDPRQPSNGRQMDPSK